MADMCDGWPLSNNQTHNNLKMKDVGACRAALYPLRTKPPALK